MWVVETSAGRATKQPSAAKRGKAGAKYWVTKCGPSGAVGQVPKPAVFDAIAD